MNAMERDQKLRAILVAATQDNVVSSATAIMDLGFPGSTALTLVTRVVEAQREKGARWHEGCYAIGRLEREGGLV